MFRAVGYFKRVSRLSSYNEDRTRGSSNYSFGNTAQHESPHAATAMGSNDDEVGFPALRLIENDFNRISRAHDLVGDCLICSGRRYHLLELLSIAFLRGFIDAKRARLQGA